jgi:pimeloyl-ACP methyl ester carboxylesterase
MRESISNDAGDLQRIATAVLTPTRGEPALSSVAWETQGTVDSKAGPIAYWSSGAGPAVLLVHGWEATHADLDAFAAPLIARGVRAVALDLPAHGASSGTTASLPDCGEAIAALGALVGPVAGVVAHSAGCPATAYALLHGLRAERVALVGTPERYDRYVRWMAQESGVDGDALIAALLARGVDVASLVLTENVAGLDVPALVVHCVDDRTCDVAGARRVAAAWRGSQLLEVAGLGHTRILRDPAVVRRIVDFIASA